MVERKMSATPAEWEVLEVLFRRAPLSAREVYDALAGARGSYRTVRTLLERLLGKGVLKRSDSHGIWGFEPACRREETLREEGRGFLRRFFSGRAELGAAYFIENGDVSREELERLRALLERKLNGEEAE